MQTTQLRAQHICLLDQATRLSGVVSASQTPDTARRACDLIHDIDGMLVEHLTVEDAWLYPTLMESSDPDVRVQAAMYSEDMGGILGAWLSYRDRWDEAAVATNFERFRIATAGIVGALALRIERENHELYPAIDALMIARGEIAAAA